MAIMRKRHPVRASRPEERANPPGFAPIMAGSSAPFSGREPRWNEGHSQHSPPAPIGRQRALIRCPNRPGVTTPNCRDVFWTVSVQLLDASIEGHSQHNPLAPIRQRCALIRCPNRPGVTTPDCRDTFWTVSVQLLDASNDICGWPVSRILSGVSPWMTIHLGAALLQASSSQPGPAGGKAPPGLDAPRDPYLALLPAGLAVPVRLPVPRWSLTPPFHPYRVDFPAETEASHGGLFSVALSLSLRWPGVTRRRCFMESGLSSNVAARGHPAIRRPLI